MRIAVENTFPSRRIRNAIGTSLGSVGQRRTMLSCDQIVGRHGEGVLQTVGHQQRTGLVDIALLHDEFDDRCGGDRVEAAGRRIVEQYFGFVMIARAMATRRRIPPESSEGNLSTVCSSSTKLSTSRTRRSISSSGAPLFHQPEGDIFPDRQRIKECALLKNDAYSSGAARRDPLPHLGYVLTQHMMSAPVRPHETRGQFENCAFARTRDAKDRLRLAMRQPEGNSLRTRCRRKIATLSNPSLRRLRAGRRGWCCER